MTQGKEWRPFPWREAAAFGLGVLRLPSQHFWALTPRELALAAEGVFGRGGTPGALTRADLATLLDAFPDVASPQVMRES
ncbi:MAG: rcc01693 family protein [Alsobacter sp.]